MIFPFDKSITGGLGLPEHSASQRHGDITHRARRRALESNNDEENVNRRNAPRRNACGGRKWHKT